MYVLQGMAADGAGHGLEGILIALRRAGAEQINVVEHGSDTVSTGVSLGFTT